MEEESRQEFVFPDVEDLNERESLLFDVTNSQAYKAGRLEAMHALRGPGFWVRFPVWKPVNSLTSDNTSVWQKIGLKVDIRALLQAVQEALQAGDLSSAQADAAKERYAAIHRHFVQAMAKEKHLLDEAKQLNEELLVSSMLLCCMPNLLNSAPQSDFTAPQHSVYCVLSANMHCCTDVHPAN